MIRLFTSLHDPAFEGDRDKAVKDAIKAIERGLISVQGIDDDRIFAPFSAELLNPFLRTNAFAESNHGALAFKIESAKSARSADTCALARNIRLQPTGRGNPSARRTGCARRTALV